MEAVKPLIRCTDYWPGEIPPNKLAAYKRLIEAGLITRQHVLYNRTTGSVTVEYLAAAPHDWIREALRKEATAG